MSTQQNRIAVVIVLVSGMLFAIFGSAAAQSMRQVWAISALVPNNASSCTNRSSFVADVTIPDGSQIEPGKTFTKVWRIRNSGTCTWSTNYSFVHYNYSRLGAPVRIKLKERVAPGKNVDIAVSFVAPTTSGSYRSTWQMEAPNGVNFGIKPFLQFDVVDQLGMLKQEVFFAAVGGDRNLCDLDMSGAKFETESIFHNSYLITMRDIPLDDVIQIGLRMPSGKVITESFSLHDVTSVSGCASRKSYEYSTSSGAWIRGFQEGNRNVLEVSLFVPTSVPTGQWTVTTRTKDAKVSRNFTVKPNTEPDIVIMATSRVYDPFKHIYCDRVKSSQAIKLQGDGFPKNLSFPIGIYRDRTSSAGSTLVADFILKSDKQGKVSTTFTMGNRFGAGTYRLLVPAAAINTGSRQAERYSLGLSNSYCFQIVN